MEHNSIRKILKIEKGAGEKQPPNNVKRNSVCSNCFWSFPHAIGGYLGHFFELKAPIEHINEVSFFFLSMWCILHFSFMIFLEFNGCVILSTVQQNCLWWRKCSLQATTCQQNAQTRRNGQMFRKVRSPKTELGRKRKYEKTNHSYWNWICH